MLFQVNITGFVEIVESTLFNQESVFNLLHLAREGQLKTVVQHTVKVGGEGIASLNLNRPVYLTFVVDESRVSVLVGNLDNHVLTLP